MEMVEAVYTLKSDEMANLYTEIKLSINKRLYERGYITEEMYIRAKEVIIKKGA